MLVAGGVETSTRTQGPLRIAVANVTSLRAHLDTVFAQEAGVLLLPETHLTAIGQRVMAPWAREAGWQAFWGAPLQSRGGGIWDCPLGGIGVLVLQGHPVREEKPRAGALDSDTASELWHSVRWCHVLVGLGTWANILHVQAIYRVPSQPELNHAAWERALEYVVPQGVGGVLKFLLDHLH